MSKRSPITSPLRRMIRLGGLAGRVGASVMGSRVLDIGRSAEEVRRRRVENLTRNATRVVETLGQMKGAAMKVGQMLSLHEGLLPHEVATVLRKLQSQAPRVPFDVMQAEVRSQLPAYDDLFARLEPEAFAAASIGQVHRGVLRDGRPVAVKIQYPEIDRIVRADLVNLRRLLQAVFAMVSEADFDPVWQEVRERLLEEIDYEQEAKNAQRFAELHEDVPEVIVPEVIEEASTRSILTMAYVEGIPAEEGCSDRYPQALRDRWGLALFELVLRSLFRHRLLHADPNLANFTFREDGRVVVYDFGCLKRVPERLARGYALLMHAALVGRRGDIPELLLGIDVRDEAGGPLGRDLTDPYYDLLAEVLRPSPPYRFGEDDRLYDKLLELGVENWAQQLDVRFPHDIIFIQRSLSGHFGNLCRLRATANWRELVGGYVQPWVEATGK